MSAEQANPPIDLLSRYDEYLVLKHPLQVLETKDPWRVGCGLVLAAHCSDAAVNKAAPGFFSQYPDWKSVTGKTRNDLIPFLPGISHSGNKSDYIINWADYLEAHGGNIEPTIEALTQVKGFGRKTAGILLFIVKGIDEAIPLDTHALRILDRLGWFPATKNPEVRQKQLLPWTSIGRRFATFTILTQHGRHVCGAKAAKCGECQLSAKCAFFAAQARAGAAPA
jgi:endonuclease-3